MKQSPDFENSLEESTLKPQPRLSKRQRQILLLMNKGLIYKEIAHALGINENTVAYHMTALRKKLNCKSSREVLAKAYKLGFFET